MVVVVAIIALLLAIAVPVSVGVVRSSESKATQSTLETVQNAIETFQNDRPLRRLGNCWGLYGPLPPSPASTSRGPEADPRPDKWALVPIDTASDFTTGIIPTYLSSGPLPDGTPRPDAAYVGTGDANRNAATSECLLLFIRRFSPQGRVIIDRLGKSLTNQDADAVQYSDGRREDLFELRDAWGNPVRYTVQNIGHVVGGQLYRWELRSAGADGKFSDVDISAPADNIPDPFSPEAAENVGDDIIVSGSAKGDD